MLRVLDFAEKRRHELALLLARRKATAADGPPILRRLRRRTTSHRRWKGRNGLRLRGKVQVGTRKKTYPTLEERLRRGDVRRLETHVWHAKRMVMEKQWGWLLPTSLSRKPGKAVWKAVKSNCGLHDASYRQLVEVTARQSVLSAFMAPILDPEEHASLLEPNHVTGKRAGRCLLYGCGTFPSGCLGPIRFLWNPVSKQEAAADDERKLWLWVHGAMEDDALQLLNTMRGLEGQAWSGALSVQSLGDELMLLELRGMAAHSAARQVLVPFSAGGAEGEDDQVGGGEGGEGADPLAVAALRNGRVWKGELWDIGNAARLPEGTVVALTVEDPRHLSPSDMRQRAGAKDQGGEEREGEGKEEKRRRGMMRSRRRRLMKAWPAHLSQSPLWLKDVRDFATSCMARRPDRRIHAMRQHARQASTWHALLPPPAPAGTQPGTRAPSQQPPPAPVSSAQASQPPALCIPVLLISTSRGHGGYDVLLPKGWGRAFFQSLLHAKGVKALGLRDVASLALQQQEPLFPRDYPDTPAGTQHWAHLVQADKGRRARRPPSKRHALPSPPFLHPSSAPFVVVRSPAYVEALLGAALPPSSPPSIPQAPHTGFLPWQPDLSAGAGSPAPTLAIRTMALILIESLGCGVAHPCSSLLLPTPEDYAAWEREATVDRRAFLDGRRAAEREGDREVVGWVTAAGFSWHCAKGWAFAFVGAEAVQEQRRRSGGLGDREVAGLLLVQNHGLGPEDRGEGARQERSTQGEGAGGDEGVEKMEEEETGDEKKGEKRIWKAAGGGGVAKRFLVRYHVLLGV